MTESGPASTLWRCAAGCRSTVRRHTPDGVRKVIGDNQSSARIYSYADRAAARLAVRLPEPCYEVDRRSCWTSITERHEDNLVADGFTAIPAPMLPDEHTVSELRTHLRHGEGETERGNMGSQGVVGTDCRRDQLRILRSHSRVDVASPIAERPSIESAFADSSQVVRDKIGTYLVALVHHSPDVAGSRLNGERGGVAQAGGIASVRSCLGIDLPHHGPVHFGRHPAFGDVAVGTDAYI